MKTIAYAVLAFFLLLVHAQADSPIHVQVTTVDMPIPDAARLKSLLVSGDIGGGMGVARVVQVQAEEHEAAADAASHVGGVLADAAGEIDRWFLFKHESDSRRSILPQHAARGHRRRGLAKAEHRCFYDVASAYQRRNSFFRRRYAVGTLVQSVCNARARWERGRAAMDTLGVYAYRRRLRFGAEGHCQDAVRTELRQETCFGRGLPQPCHQRLTGAARRGSGLEEVWGWAVCAACGMRGRQQGKTRPKAALRGAVEWRCEAGKFRKAAFCLSGLG